MVPKESGFNQSVAASGMCVRKAWRFPCSLTVERDGEVIQIQHFFITETQFAIQSQVT